MSKKLVALLLIVAPVFAACRASAPAPGAQGGGAVSSRAAVEQFLAAARAQDYGAMSLIWGDAKGPIRASETPDRLERRTFSMMCHVRHDNHRIVDETPGLHGQRRVTIELTAGQVTRRTNIMTVPATAGGWYVNAVDLEPLRDICANRPQ